MALLALIILIIFIKGFRALTLDMLTKIPEGGYYYGGEGGVLNAIIGSLYIALGATFIAIIIGTPAALYINVHLIRYRRTQNTIRYLLDALWGIPSIVYGAFGFTLMLYMGLNASLLAGIITVALLITPIMIRTFDEVLSTIPIGLQEAALALGSTKTETAFKVLFKQGLSGFITAILLSFGRGIGDAASVLFTAGYTDLIPQNMDEPAATLPLAIFFQLSSPIPEVRERAFAAAVILTVIILIISLTARYLTVRFSKSNIK
ncbi:MAG: ABC transporter permease subunit [Bacteroidales bacterium]|nr:ABC transporter permease subunit [Bacteroidales bacterium]